jgi:hypothetical protein
VFVLGVGVFVHVSAIAADANKRLKQIFFMLISPA